MDSRLDNGLPIPPPSARNQFLPNGLPIPPKKKDGGLGGSTGLVESAPITSPSNPPSGLPENGNVSIFPTKENFMSSLTEPPKTVTTFDGTQLAISPDDKSPYANALHQSAEALNGLQQRILSKTPTPLDLEVLSQGSGKSVAATQAYITKGKDIGAATDINDNTQNTAQQLKNNISSLSKNIGGTVNPDDVINNPDEGSSFLSKINSAVEATKGMSGYLQGIIPFVKSVANVAENLLAPTIDKNKLATSINQASIDSGTKVADQQKALVVQAQKTIPVLVQNITDNTAKEVVDNGMDDSQAADLLYKRLDPLGYEKSAEMRSQQPESTGTKIGTSLINGIAAIKNFSDWVTNTEENNKELLNAEKGQYELLLNRGMANYVAQLKAKGISEGDQQSIDKANTLIPKIKDENDIVEKYPMLMKQQMADYINQRYAQETGILNGTETQGINGELLKLGGVNTDVAKRYLQEGGFYDKPNFKDYADDVAEHPATYLATGNTVAGAPMQFLNVFKSIFNSVADLEGVRTATDRHAENIQSQLFPSELTQNIKPDVSFDLAGHHFETTIAKTVNGIAHLGGYIAASALGGEIGGAAGLSTNAAQRAAAWGSFGADAIDSGLKTADQLGLTPAQSWLYAGMNAVMMSEGGRLLEFGKGAPIPQIPGVNQKIADAAIGLTNKSLTDDAAKELVDGAVNTWGDALKKWGIGTAKGAGVMSAFGVGDKMLHVAAGDPNANLNDILPEAANSYFDGLLTMGIIGGFGLPSDIAKSKNSTYKAALSSLVDNHDAAQDILKIGLDKGLFSQQEYDQKLATLNTGLKAKSTLNGAIAKTGVKLDGNQRQTWIANATAEQVLRNQAEQEGTSEAEATQYTKQADALKDQNEKIFNGLKFSILLEPQYNLYDAQQALNEAQKVYAETPTPENEQSVIDKKAIFDKFNENYQNGIPESKANKEATTEAKVPLSEEASPTNEAVDNDGKEAGTNEADLISQAKDIVNTDVVKGYSAETLKDAANNRPEDFKNYLSEIAQQAHDEKSVKATVDTYGQPLVDIATKLFPKEEAKPYDPNSGKVIVEPSKPISEMNSEEIGAYANEVRQALKKQDKEFANKTEKEKEDGGYYDYIDNVAELRDTEQRVNFVENSENLDDLANSTKSALRDFNKDNPSQESLAILNAAKKKAAEMNIEPETLIKEVIKKVGNDYKDKNDAEFMMRNYLEKVVPAENKPTISKEQTEPTTKEVEGDGNKNIPFEKSETASFYHADKLKFEDADVDVSEPRPVMRDSSRGGGKMYDEITVSSKDKFYNSVLKEDIPHIVHIIDRGDGTFAVSVDRNKSVEAKTYDDALKVAKTVLAIEARDKKAVFDKDYSSKNVYDFSNQNLPELTTDKKQTKEAEGVSSNSNEANRIDDLKKELNQKIDEIENPKKEIKISSSSEKSITDKLNKVGNPKVGDVLNIDGSKWIVNKTEKRQTFEDGKYSDTDGYRINITSNNKGENRSIYTDTNDFIKHEKSLSDIQKIEQLKDEYDQKIKQQTNGITTTEAKPTVSTNEKTKQASEPTNKVENNSKNKQTEVPKPITQSPLPTKEEISKYSPKDKLAFINAVRNKDAKAIQEITERNRGGSVKLDKGSLDVGEEMGKEKFPSKKQVYDWIEDEEGRQGGSFLNNEFGEARFESKAQAKAYADEVHGFLESVADKELIPVYRAVSAKDVDLSPYGIGESWSYDLGAAKEFGRHLGVPIGKLKIISGLVPRENVDWETAVRNYHNFSDAHSGESEFELPVPSNRVIKNVKVSDFKNASEIDSVKLDKSNNADAAFETRDGKRIGFDYDTDKVARERFDFSKLKQIGKGSDRTVFDLGDGKVLKVAHTARGLEQNIYEGDRYLKGIVPDVHERGLNYVVTDKVPRIKANDIVPTYDVETGEQNGTAKAGEMIRELGKFNQKDFDNKTSGIQDVLRKYGLGDVMDYDVLYGDFKAGRNWGYENGRPVHIDGGTFGGTRMLDNYKGKAPLSDPEFRDIYNKSKALKKQFGDTDKNTKFQKSEIKTDEGTMPVEQYVSRAKAVLEKLFPKAKFEAYDTTADYLDAGGTYGSKGLSRVDGKGNRTIMLDLQEIRDSGSGKTAFHEVIHPIVDEVVGERPEELDPLWNSLAEQMKDVKGFGDVLLHVGNYKAHEHPAAEGITELLTQISEGNISLDAVPPARKGVIIDLLNKLFEKLGLNIRFGDNYDFKSFATDIKKAFETGDTEALKQVVDKKSEENQRAKDNASKISKLLFGSDKADKSETDINDVVKQLRELGLTDKEIEEGLKQSGDSEADIKRALGGGDKSGNVGETEGLGQGDGNAITHAAISEFRAENNFEQFAHTTVTDAELNKRADQAIAKGYNVNDLWGRIAKGHNPNDVETVILKKAKNAIAEAVQKDPSPENLKKALDFANASDIAGQIAGRSFRARQDIDDVDVSKQSLSDFFVTRMRNKGVTPETITDAQKSEIQKQYNDLKDAHDKLEQKVAKLVEADAKKKAESAVKKMKDRASSQPKKTHEEYVKERKSLVEQLKAAKEKAEERMKGITKSGFSITITPEMAKIIGKIAFSHVSEGAQKLQEVSQKVYNEIKDVFEGVTQQDVVDVLAGAYNAVKPEKNDILKQIAALRSEAIKESSLAKERKDVQRLKTIKKTYQGKIDKLKEDLRTGKYLQEKDKPEPLKLDKEALALKDQYISIKQETQRLIAKDEYNKKSKAEKAKINALEALNIPRTIMSSSDFSAVLRQAVVPSVTHPIMALKSMKGMFADAFSEKKFDRWLFDLKESPLYDEMNRSGVYISDPHDMRLSKKEEAYMNNIVERIPYIGSWLVKGSERAYLSYLNRMRVELYGLGSDVMARNGKTIENSAKDFEGLASFVNNMTGRGGVPEKMELATPLISAGIFAPRLIASRLNLLGLSDITGNGFYSKLPPKVRKMAITDMAKFVMFGSAVLALSSLVGDDKKNKTVELDPRSSDFGKIRVGDTRYDIWGGFQQYVTFFARQLTGVSKSVNNGKIYDLNGKGAFGRTRWDTFLSFARGKASPAVGMGIDFLAGGRTVVGDKILYNKVNPFADYKKKEVPLGSYLANHFFPMTSGDIYDAVQSGDMRNLFAIPATIFGISVQTFNDKK